MKKLSGSAAPFVNAIILDKRRTLMAGSPGYGTITLNNVHVNVNGTTMTRAELMRHALTAKTKPRDIAPGVWIER